MLGVVKLTGKAVCRVRAQWFWLCQELVFPFLLFCSRKCMKYGLCRLGTVVARGRQRRSNWGDGRKGRH